MTVELSLDDDQADVICLALPSMRILVTKSGGTDGAIVIMVDTNAEPDGSDGGPPIRVLVNDGPVYEGVPYSDAGQDEGSSG